MTRSATIRVAVGTRDTLSELARAHGESLSGYLSGIARAARREAVLEAERTATLADARESSAREEHEAWEGSLGDGLD